MKKKRLGMDQLASLANLTTVHNLAWSTVGLISKLAVVSAAASCDEGGTGS